MRISVVIKVTKSYKTLGTSRVVQGSASARDMGLIPGTGGPHMPQSNCACAQLLSPSSRAHEPQLLSPRATTTEAHTPRAHAPQQGKPPR